MRQNAVLDSLILSQQLKGTWADPILARILSRADSGLCSAANRATCGRIAQDGVPLIVICRNVATAKSHGRSMTLSSRVRTLMVGASASKAERFRDTDSPEPRVGCRVAEKIDDLPQVNRHRSAITMTFNQLSNILSQPLRRDGYAFFDEEIGNFVPRLGDAAGTGNASSGQLAPRMSHRYHR